MYKNYILRKKYSWTTCVNPYTKLVYYRLYFFDKNLWVTSLYVKKMLWISNYEVTVTKI